MKEVEEIYDNGYSLSSDGVSVEEKKDKAEIVKKNKIKRETDAFLSNVSDSGNLPYLSPVYASTSGVVLLNGLTDSDAFRIGIDTGDGFRDNYIHLLATTGYSMPEGAQVQEGDIIGFVANPTNGAGSHNPHVHIERISESTGLTIHPGCKSPLLNGLDASGWYMDIGWPYPENGHRGIDWPVFIY